MKSTYSSARQLGLISCHDCHLLSRAPDLSAHEMAYCPRCGEELHQRKPNSIVRTWALVIAAMVFYVPANVLPMTITTALGSAQADTGALLRWDVAVTRPAGRTAGNMRRS